MVQTNYLSCLIKVLEAPKQTQFSNQKLRMEVRALLPQTKERKVLQLMIWEDVLPFFPNSWKPNDYLFVEGFLSFNYQPKLSRQQLQLTVLKIYPIFLNQERFVPSFVK